MLSVFLWPSLPSLAAAGCEVGFSEAHCVVGWVIRPMNLSLPHRHTLWSHSWPIWPTTPTSPLPLSGWDDRGREPREESEKRSSLPRVALQMWFVCLSGRNAASSRWTGRGTGRVRRGHMPPSRPLDGRGHVPCRWLSFPPVGTRASHSCNADIYSKRGALSSSISISANTVQMTVKTNATGRALWTEWRLTVLIPAPLGTHFNWL